ncbi:hypothetical protein CC80DRAFT_465134 [Byssothecium circinans]|uniref:Uncharacterized protein n=1 Tax=Byssothecium circinans TaxID=147558 RepID=A0A6A5UA44_9PLEO|nr:hypothetical protein CC80DRAFT_465134 [Byssothecium circinans]
MPRPKRAKVASAPIRVAKPLKSAPRKQEPTKATKPRKIPLTSFSDDSDGLVVKSTRPQKRMPWQPEPQKDVDYTMTGALPISSSKNRTPARNTSRRTRNSTGSVAVSSTRKTPASAAIRQPRSTRAGAPDAPSQEEDSSGFGDHLLSFTSLDSDSPAHGTRPPSAIKVGATPAHETSILALTNFKRRPRQHSLLRMVQQTTDVEDNDADDFDFDDFLPEAESTPLPNQKGASGEPPGNDNGVNVSSSGSRGTKRKLSPVIQVPRSSPPYESDPDVGERDTSPKVANEEESEGEETDRPKKAKGRHKANSHQAISTAKLQALLPRRRTRMPQDEDEFDIPSEGSDQDELAQPQRRQTAGARKSTASKVTKKPSRAVKKTAAKLSQKNARTYGRRRSSDKENEEALEEDEDDESEIHDTIAVEDSLSSKSLQAIAKKFEEVDDFELEFESVSYVTSSSPHR